MTAVDMAGFDPTDSSTWHPMHSRVVGALQGAVAQELGIPLGANLAPAAERIARTLYPLATATASQYPDGTVLANSGQACIAAPDDEGGTHRWDRSGYVPSTDDEIDRLIARMVEHGAPLVVLRHGRPPTL